MYNIYGRINLPLLSLCSPWTTVMAAPWSVGSPCLLWIHFFPLAFPPISLSENSILSSHLLLGEICSQGWVQGKQEPIIISAINDLSDWLKGLTLRTNQNSSPRVSQPQTESLSNSGIQKKWGSKFPRDHIFWQTTLPTRKSKVKRWRERRMREK